MFGSLLGFAGISKMELTLEELEESEEFEESVEGDMVVEVRNLNCFQCKSTGKCSRGEESVRQVSNISVRDVHISLCRAPQLEDQVLLSTDFR